MPTTLRGTYKQRLRWSRSWWWMLPYVVKYLGPKQLLSPLYGVTQLLVTPIMVAYVAGGVLWSSGARYESHGRMLLVYLAAYVVVRYALAALYLIGRPNVSVRRKLVLFLVGTPAAVLLNVLLLVPTRYVALGKLFDNRWQTRELSATQLSRFRDAALLREAA